MPGFMLDTERLLASELWALSDGQTFKAALALWCRAWRQVPAASLPDDEAVLRAFTGLSATTWKKARSLVLRGFVRCNDGRLYHMVLAEDATRAWAKRGAFRDRAAAAAQARWERQNRDATSMRQASVEHPPSIVHNMLADAQGQGQGQGQGHISRSTPPPPSGISSREGADAPPPPATSGDGARARISGVRYHDVRIGIERGDAIAVLTAYGCNMGRGRKAEWIRDSAGMQVGELATILWEAMRDGEPIREPSGLRARRASWQDLPLDDRRAIGSTAMAEIGICVQPA
jgi:uncharacterized protein YdaU (DUF1376 family)